MNIINSCLVCSSDNFSICHYANYSGGVDGAARYFLASRKSIGHGQINRCNSCGFRFTSPQFNASDYPKIYELATRSGDVNTGLAEAEKIRGSKIAKILSNFITPDSSVLDFGCGEGGFLNALNTKKKYGIEVVGLHGHSKVKAEFLIGDLIRLKSLGLIENEYLDVITAIDVFEHLPNLNSYLEILISMLKPGGILFLTLPNSGSISARVLGGRWSMYLLEHLWYFSPDTLIKWLSNFGLFNIEIGPFYYDVPLSHVIERINHSSVLNLSFLNAVVPDKIVPIPIGLMYGIFKKT